MRTHAAKKASPKSHAAKPHAKSRGQKKREESAEGEETRRSMWTGSISFGLLQIPVSLHTAEKPDEIHFRQLDRHDLAPIRYSRVNEDTGKPVEWKDIARGYEYSPGEYVVVDDKDLQAANVEATQTIDLQDFVDIDSIFPAFFEKPYFLAPGKRADKAYALFRDALIHKNVAAIGTVVIRTRQRLCAIIPQGDVLILELLRFGHELRSTEGIRVPKRATASARELEMAEQLIETMRGEWDPSKYKDSYHDDLMALIEEKAKTGKVKAPPKRAAPGGKVVDLMALLQKSLAEKKKGGQGEGKKSASKKRMDEAA